MLVEVTGHFLVAGSHVGIRGLGNLGTGVAEISVKCSSEAGGFGQARIISGENLTCEAI